MSDFYSVRRTAIRDLGGLSGFLLGFLGASPRAYAELVTAYMHLEFNTGLVKFILLVTGTGVAVGLLGLGVGALAADVWVRQHQRRRGLIGPG